jgi:hypothetical protein
MLSNGWLKISSNEFVLLAKAHISQPVLLRLNSDGRQIVGIGNMSSFDGIQPINHFTPELNPSAQRCLTRFFTVDFAY